MDTPNGLYLSYTSERDREHLYNAAVLISDTGELLLKHRKIGILSHLMNPPYQPAENIQTCETRFGRVGLLICADTFDDAHLDAMAALKPELLLVPYTWAAAEENGLSMARKWLRWLPTRLEKWAHPLSVRTASE